MGTPRTAQRNKSKKATWVCAVVIEVAMLSLTATQALPDFQSFCCFSGSLNWHDLAENDMELKTTIQKEWTNQPNLDFTLQLLSQAVNQGNSCKSTELRGRKLRRENLSDV